MSNAQVIADLEAALEAAKAEDAIPAEPTEPAATDDTSGLPGGVDSAPVNEPGPAPAAPAAAAPESELDKLAAGAETDTVDIITELKEGASISDVANKLLDQDGLTSIVKAIDDLAGKVF